MLKCLAFAARKWKNKLKMPAMWPIRRMTFLKKTKHNKSNDEFTPQFYIKCQIYFDFFIALPYS